MARTFYISIEKRGTVTNGDMIKAIFGNTKVTPICNGFCSECEYYSDETDKCNVRYWWDAPYKGGMIANDT